MDIDLANLPSDTEALRALVRVLAGDVKNKTLLIEQLKNQIAKLKRMQFSKSSEKIDREIAQLELQLDELHEDEGHAAATSPAVLQALINQAPEKPYRKPLPDHLPREEEVHEPACTCPNCGGAMRKLGEDVTEILEYVPASFKVIRHVRPKLSCRICETIVQSPMPSLPIERGRPGPGLLAHVLVAKYADHLPLYRQSVIYAREGVELERSTLADWVGGSAALLDPLIEALRKDVLASDVLHGDDTPVPVLAPGLGKTKTGRLWTYVRDGRPHGSDQPPAAVFFYSPDRKGEHPQSHLKDFKGVLHADGYAGFNAIFETGHTTEAACWAHVRRKFFDVHAANASPIAKGALDKIGSLYAIEAHIRGWPPDERQRYREHHSAPLIADLKAWLEATLPKLSGKSDVALAMRYALSRWAALTNYIHNGRTEIDNNAAERSIRGIALGRKNYLFAGSDKGGNRAAAIYSLIETCKLNAIDPEAYLRDILARIPDYKINRIDELLPWNWQALQNVATNASHEPTGYFRR
ncbi:MAG: IS66 family transposase [Aestuariivirga sp.]